MIGSSGKAAGVTQNGPDLTGSWRPFSVYFKGSLIMGRLQVSNIGNKKASQFRIAYYLSADGIKLGKLIRKSIFPASLNAGQTKTFPFPYFSATPLFGKYIVAELTATTTLPKPTKPTTEWQD